MTDLRAAKVAGVDVPDLVVFGDVDADLLVIGWGSSYGSIRAGVRRAREGGTRVAVAHFHHLNPLPANTGEVLRRLRARAAAGDEHAASSPRSCAPSSSSTSRATRRSRPSRCSPPRSSRRSSRVSDADA